MRTVSIGLIGAGRIGRMHAELLARRVPGAAWASSTTSTRPSPPRSPARLGVPRGPSLSRSCCGSDVDAVAICSSADTHVDLMVAAAEAGKAVFCEKPVSLFLDELERGLDAIEAHGAPFQVGFNRRFDPAHASVQQAVASGRIGEPHLVRISSRDPEPPSLDYVRTSGGLFLDMTIHDFDMARFVTGSEVVEVFARGGIRVAPAFAEAGDIDTAMVTLVHASGCLTAIDNCRATAYGFDQRVEAFGSGGMAASENPPAHSGVLTTADGTHRPSAPALLPRALSAQLRARVAGFRRGAAERHAAAGGRRRRARSARHRAGGAAVAARGAGGAPGRGGGRVRSR